MTCPLVQVLLPALRADMEQLPLPADSAKRSVAGSLTPQQRETVANAVELEDAPEGGAQSGSLLAAQQAPHTQPQQRRYLTCCVRLSPEKEPERFVAAVEALVGSNVLAAAPANGLHSSAVSSSAAAAASNRLRQLGVVPLLCGSADTPFASQLKVALLLAVIQAPSMS